MYINAKSYMIFCPKIIYDLTSVYKIWLRHVDLRLSVQVYSYGEIYPVGDNRGTVNTSTSPLIFYQLGTENAC